MNKKFFSNLLFFVPLLILTVFIFKSLLFNISTNLLDWLDYPVFLWIIFQNIDHIRSLSFSGIFDTNIFYPFHGTLLFADLFLPQTILLFPFTLISQNKILDFNISFFLTLILNLISVTFFWNKFNFSTSKWWLFFAVLTTAYSPYFFLNYGHYQMVTFWPLFFGLSYLFDKNITTKKVVLAAIFTTIQFLASVYLSIFMLFSIGVWFGLKILLERNRSDLAINIKRLAIFLLVFTALTGPFLYKYIQVKNAYGIVRDYSEYVLYSAHLSDYIFSTHYHSLLDGFAPLAKWNHLNGHYLGESAGFPGFVLLGLGILGLFKYSRNKKNLSLQIPLEFNHLYFLILALCGFIFSLGPRLNVNGFYTAIPLPYLIPLKLIPIFEPIRASARWSFLFYFGLTYFALIGLQKLKKYNLRLLVILLSILYVIEMVPIDKQTEQKNYNPDVYKIVVPECKNAGSVLLEYPLTQDSKDANIITNLTYKTQMMLASLEHNCDLVNGYSGYTPKDYDRFEGEMFQAVEKNDSQEFNKLVNQRNVKLFKLNKDFIYREKVASIEGLLKEEGATILVDDEHYTVARVNR